ncbi:hypothetical protein FQA47_007431 [Oryzias melastigma]|uniref:Uncharacterized protein n=1 Tax=Oryzias melastigma TaxID=30732 RepID=A0A834F8Q7_ORYME|nr:hypothetical protein FQA47_007431 [Oryzias melastigma]
MSLGTGQPLRTGLTPQAPCLHESGVSYVITKLQVFAPPTRRLMSRNCVRVPAPSTCSRNRLKKLAPAVPTPFKVRQENRCEQEQPADFNPLLTGSR